LYGYRYYNILSSGYYENQTWCALHKAWVGYWIAIYKFEYDRKELQRELGLEVSEYDCLT
jgi:hypothetical protein